MKKRFQKALGIYPKESQTLFRFVRLAIFWSSSCNILFILSTSLFIEHVGAKFIPLSYMIIAIILIFSSIILIYLLRISSPYKVFSKVAYFAAISLIILAILLSKPSFYLYFSMQVLAYVFLEFFIANFWNFLDQYHDLQDAKRTYGIYNTAYFLGFMLSGTLINQTYEKLGKIFLISIAALFMILSIIESKKIHKKAKPIEEDMVDLLFSKGKRGLKSILRQFIKSPFSVFLIISSIIVELIRNTTEFSYFKGLENIFKIHPNSDRAIAEFLGKCNAFVAAFSIIIGIFFYRRFVKRFGIKKILFIPPIIFLSLYSGWFFYHSLFIIVIAIFSDKGVLDTIDENNFNILISGVPSKIKGIVRIINNSFFESVGMLFSSILLLFLSSNNIMFGFVLSIGFLSITFLVKYLFPKAILKNLKETSICFQKSFKDRIKKISKKELKELKEDIFAYLDTKEEKIKLLAIESLLKLEDKKLLLPIIHSLKKSSENFKKKFLELLEKTPFSYEPLIIETVKEWIKNSSYDLVIKGKLYLAKRGFIDPKDLFQNNDPFFLSIMIYALKRFESPENLKLAKEKIEELLSKKETFILSALEIIAFEKEKDFFEKVWNLLDYPSKNVQRKAAYTLSKITSKDHLAFLEKILKKIKNSSDSFIRIHLLQSLEKICYPKIIKEIILSTNSQEIRHTENLILKMGKKAIPSLLFILKNQKYQERHRLLCGKILSRIHLETLTVHLKEILENEIKSAYFYYFSGTLLQKKYPMEDLNLLKKALLTSYKSKISFIIHLIGASSSLEDTDLLIHSLRNDQEIAHAHAMETLEQNCSFKIFQKISPLLDQISLEYKMEAYEKIYGKKFNFTLNNLLNILENSSSLFNRIVAINVLAKLKPPNWKKFVKKYIGSKNEIFNQYAREFLK